MRGAVRSSSSLKSSASVTSIGTLYPSRSRAHSQLNTIPSNFQEEEHQLGPVRKTYLGGVGVYLNHDQGEDENSEDEGESLRAGGSQAKPNLTINVDLCKEGTELSKNTGNWYSRLLLSPLSSAGSSVYSFLVNTASPSLDEEEPPKCLEQNGVSEKALPTTALTPKPGTSWKQPFRRHK
jgi:hypothetical protein